MMRGYSVAVALLLVAGSLAVPVKREASAPGECATRCTGVQNTYRYETGKTYLYKLKSSTDIVVDGISNAPTNVTQTAELEIAVQSPCEFSLKVKSIKIDGASVPASFATDVQKNAVRFSFDDGRVGEICPTEDEQPWVLNIKRAMLSTLQNAFEQDGESQETDVSGHCSVTYESRDENNERHITRNRDMHSCKGHHGLHGAIRATPYDTKSEIQSAPLAERNQECTHHVDSNGILKDARCVESHQFKSFSDRSEGMIQSTTRIQINFEKTNNKVEAKHFHAINNRHSLEFDHSEIREQISSEAKAEAHSVIDLLCAEPERIVKNTPTQFTDLVGKLRKMDEATLRNMLKEAESKSKCTAHLRFLMDALPMCGTEACVNVMVDELKTSTKLTEADKHTWFMSMAFVPRVTEEMVNRAADLVDTLHGKELLGIGSLVHTFCRNEDNCGQNEGVTKLLNKLVAKLGDSCTPAGADKQSVEKIIIVLKAIGNIGSVESITDDLKKCFEKTENPTETRVAAIQALRRVPCTENKKTTLLSVLQDRSEEVEARIHAFLSVVNCNCRVSIQKVNEILEEETVNQVGSFIWSYLSEKRQSSNPSDSALRHILRTEPISRRFERDPDQYSRFSQSGSISQKMNSGAHYETAVIYAPGSYLPRSEYFNLTVHLFGHSVNLFEIGARQEGMDHVLDRVLGPEGLLTSPQNYYDFGGKKENKQSKALDALDEKFQSRDVYKQSKAMSMSFYMKMFGDELAYFGIHDANTMKMIENSYDMKTLGEFFSKERELNMAKNFLFVDTTKTMPTLSGLPLRLTVTGAASMNVVVGGKADLTKVFRQPHNAELKTIMKPSAAIEITTTLAIQTIAGKVGYVQKARLFTSIAVETEFALKDGKTLKAITRLPQDRMDIFDIDVQAHRIAGDELTQVTAVSVDRSEPMCSGDTLSQLLGVKLCGEMFSAQSDVAMPTKHYGVFIEKTDESLETYEMEVEIHTGAISYPKSFLFNTPGSKVDREVRLDVDVDSETKTVQIRTPFKELKFEGKMTAQTKGELLMTVDGTDKYNMEAEFKPEVKGSSRSYLVNAKYNKDGESPVIVTASVKNDIQKREGEVYGKIEGLSEIPYEFTSKASMASWNRKEKKVNVEYTITSPEIEATSQVLYDHGDKKCNVKLVYRVEYKQTDYAPYDFRFELNKDHSDKSKTNHKLELTKSFHPASNFELIVDQKFARTSYEKKSTLRYGQDLSKEGNMHLKWERDSNNKYMIHADAKLNEFGIDHKAKINMLNKMPEQFEMKGEINCPGATDDVVVDLNFSQKYGQKYQMEAEAKVSGVTEMRLFKKINQVNDHEFKSETVVQWADNEQAEIMSDVTIKTNSMSDYEYKMDSKIKVTGVAEPMRFTKHVKQHKNQMTYVAKLNSGERSLYDLSLDVNTAETTKAKFNMNIKSHYITGADMTVEGEMGREGNPNKFSALAKKEQKDFARIELFTPISMRGQEKHFRTQVQWALDTNAPKELTGEYKLKREANGVRKHEILAKSQLNGNNYVWKADISHDDYYKMNNTFTMDNKQVLDLSWGMLLNGYGNQAIDFELKTLEPMTKRHLTGNFLFESVRQNLNLKSSAEVKCQLSQKRVGYNVEIKKDSAKEQWHSNVNVQAGEFEYDSKTLINTENNKMDASEETIIKWAADKVIKQIRTVKFSKGKIDIEMNTLTTTPWDSMKTLEYNYKVKCGTEDYRNGPCKGSLALKWNEREWVTNVETEEGKVTINMTPSSGDGMDMVFANTNKDNKLVRGITITIGEKTHMKAEYTASTAGSPHHVLLCEARKADSFDIKSRAEFKMEGHKMITNIEFKNSEDVYKMASNIDTKKDTGVIKIQSPLSELKSAKLEVKKSGTKYTIKSERNGEEGAIIEGELSGPEDPERTLKISFKGIENPVDIEASYRADADLNKIRLVVTQNDKAYGFDVSDVNENTGSKQIKGVQFTLVHPKRQPQLKFVSIDEESGYERSEIHITPDTLKSNVPTIIGVGSGRAQDAQLEVIGYLSDPRLSNKMQWTGRTNLEGNFEARFTYSDLESKALVFNLNKEQNKMTLMITHEESNLHNKIWYEVKNERNFDVGFEYKVKERLEKVGLAVKVAQNGGFSIEVNRAGAGGKLKYETKRVKSGDFEHRFMWFEQGQTKPNWVVATKMVPEKMQFVIELRKAAAGKVVLHMSDQLVTDEKHESRVWHIKNKKRVDDVYSKLWLAKNDLLKYRLHVRPETWTEVVAVIEDFGSSSTGKSVNPQNSMIIRDMMKGYAKSIKQIIMDLTNAAKEMNVFWLAENRKISEDLGSSAMAELIGDYSELVTEIMNANMDIMEMSVNEWAESMGEGLGDLNVAMKEMMSQWMAPMGDMYEGLSSLMTDMGKTMKDCNDAIVEFMQSNKFFKQMGDFLEKILMQIRRMMSNVDFDLVSQSVNKYITDSENQYGEYVEYGREYLDSLLEYSTFRGAYSSLTPFLDEIATVDVRDTIDRIFEYLKAISKGQMLTKYMPKVIEYKPEQGKFEVELALPMKVNNLHDLVRAYEPKQFTNKLQRVATQMGNLFNTNGKLSDDIWERRSITEPKDITEYNGNHASTAWIINDEKHSNIITFDGNSFRVSRSCDLLLAKDFIDNKFSISGNFEKKDGNLKLAHLNVRYVDDEEIVVKLSDDGKVLVNGAEVELPWQEMNNFDGVPVLTVRRTDHGVELSTFDGVVIKRDWYHSTVAVTLPGYYHGHSAGILGSNDNEYSNDLHLADGNVNEDVDIFVNSYKTGGKCAKHEVQPTPETPECSRYFNTRGSALRTCFRRVPPRAFHDMCTPTNLCNVTASYVSACNKVGLDLIMPDECLHCTVPMARVRRSTHHRRAVSDFTGGMTRRLESTIVKNADVVFVVMEQQCMSFAKDKIVEVAQSIKQKLAGFNSVNFGVIGFNGVGVHSEPHVHTGDYQVNFGLDGLRKAVAELEMEDPFNVATKQDPLNAVQFAATEFPFRTAAMKTIVLWTCADCGSQANYYDVQSELLQRGIQMHVMTTERVIVDGETDAELLGFDAMQMFTTAGVQGELRQSLISPHDSCTVLAQETNGTVWSVADQASSVFTMPSEQISSKITQQHENTPCMECECDSVQYAPRTVCYPCEVPTPVSLTGSSFFNVPYVQLRNTIRTAKKTIGATDMWMM
jgi:hypothetical protein